jgi:predicted nucleic acid-binding protein
VNSFCDTNIFVYALSDDHRREKAQTLIDLPFHISVQVLTELANVLRKKHKRSWDDINSRLQMIRASASVIHPLTSETNALGLYFAERYSVSVYNSMILAASWLAKCSTLYSEDMQHGLVIEDKLTILNPFL